MKTRRLSLYGALIATAMILSYVESLVPLNFGIWGIKMGLPNIAVVFALYRLGVRGACVVSLVRVFLVSLLFGNVLGFFFSIAGAVLSLAVMSLLFKTGKFSTTGVSIAGAVFHNVGQIAVAAAVLNTGIIAFYLPVLCVSGVAAGVFIGIAGSLVLKRVRMNLPGKGD